MLAKLEELTLIDSEGQPMPWVEVLIVDTDAPLKVPDINDDLTRETIMYDREFLSSNPSSLGFQLLDTLVLA